jgi:hypothetical protein
VTDQFEKATSGYSEEELQEAEQKLVAMTPEELIQLDAYVASMADQQVFPEAGGIVFTTLRTPNGSEVHMTARGIDPIEALKKLIAGIRFANAAYDMETIKKHPATGVTSTADTATTYTSTTAQPVPQPTDQNIEVIPVSSLTHAHTTKGKSYLIVKGGRYMLHGWNAWEEKIPIPAPMWQAWPVGVEKSGAEIPPEMALAWVNKQAKKVEQFAPMT